MEQGLIEDDPAHADEAPRAGRARRPRSPTPTLRACAISSLGRGGGRRARAADRDPADGVQPPVQRDRRRCAGGARRRQAAGEGRQERGHRARPRRERHRQGADRARDPLSRAAREEAVRRAELLGVQRQPARERAVRSRARRVHRRGQGSDRGLFEVADGGTFFLDEIGDMSRRAAGQAPARAAGGHVHAGRRHQAGQGRRPDHRGVAQGPRVRWSRTSSSARTCSTASTSSRSRCRRCASASATSRASRSTSSPSTGAAPSHGTPAVAERARAAGRLRLAGQHPRARERDGAHARARGRRHRADRLDGLDARRRHGRRAGRRPCATRSRPPRPTRSSPRSAVTSATATPRPSDLGISRAYLDARCAALGLGAGG